MKKVLALFVIVVGAATFTAAFLVSPADVLAQVSGANNTALEVRGKACQQWNEYKASKDQWNEHKASKDQWNEHKASKDQWNEHKAPKDQWNEYKASKDRCKARPE